MMNKYETFHALCQGRRSHRKFSPEPVPEEAIAKILETAATSPFASGRKNWKIVVIRDKNVHREMEEAVRRQTEQLVADMEPDMTAMFRRYASNFARFADVSALLLPVFRVTPVMRSVLRDRLTPSLQGWERDNAVKSISCVAMLILLAAESLDLGACYMTGPLIAGEELARIAGLAAGQEIGAIIPVGYPLK
ncbi:MAG: nitroreductase family protein [Methanothrix soehngenii]|jgi:nitroreductase|nr:nitroreductase family protein [Methanothrix soehngenii]